MAVSINGNLVAIDCWDPESTVNFVSHAHSDHISGIRKSRKVIASRITKELVETRDSRKKIELAEGIPGVELPNAGHILGSKQLYAASEELGASILYSGDYQMDNLPVAERIDLKEADILIIDSTYPDPGDIFGDRQEIILSIQKFMKSALEKGIVLFSSYALGKAQEINHIANEIGICPIVDKKISAVNGLYSRNGVNLEYLSIDNDESEFESALGRNFLGISSMSNFRELASRLSGAYNKRVYTAVASGFAKNFYMGTYAQFPLSDHADFKQALEYVSACSPSKIYTRGSHKSAGIFAKNLAKNGYNAEVFNNNIPASWNATC